MSLQEKAMLVDLSVRQWTGRKFDRAVTASVNGMAGAAKDAGRYNKQLVRRDALAPITLCASRVRNFHYRMTLPWSDGGQRLLPAKFFMDYRDRLSEMKEEFERAVDEFLNWYSLNRQGEATRLGHLFNLSDYPPVSELRKCYDISAEFFPVPAAEDFRTSISANEQDEVRRQIVESIAARQKKILMDCQARALKALPSSKSSISFSYPVVLSKLEKSAEQLEGLNVMDDPKVTELSNQLRAVSTHIKCGAYKHAMECADAIRNSL